MPTNQIATVTVVLPPLGENVTEATVVDDNFHGPMASSRWASGSDDGRTGLTMVIRRPWEAKKLPPAGDASNALEPGVPDSTDLVERDYGALRTAGRVEALRLCQLTDSCSLLARNA
jgi:hypothetical protein